VSVNIKYVVIRRFSNTGTIEDLLIRTAKAKLEKENGLSNVVFIDTIKQSNNPIIAPTSETEAK
jgi:hypothetical protein